MATEQELDYQTYLADLIEQAEAEAHDPDGLYPPDPEDPGPAEVQTFQDAEVLTTNAGLILRYPNGDVFQLTIVQVQVGAVD